MNEHVCTLCQRGRLKRSKRRGLLEQYFWPLLGQYPWRCNFCRMRVRLSDRGAKRAYVRPEE